MPRNRDHLRCRWSYIEYGTTYLLVCLQHARESLTTGNVLQGQCIICLEELSASGRRVFTQTSCYHFFHWACIYSYVEHCRREFDDSQTEHKSIGPPATEEEVFEVCIQMQTCSCSSGYFPNLTRLYDGH